MQWLVGFLAFTGLTYCLVWPIRKMRAGRILKTVSLAHPLGRFGGWFLMAAGVVMIANVIRLSLGARQIVMGIAAIVGGYAVEATRRTHFNVAELGILRFPSLFRWKDIETMDWSGPTTLRLKLRRPIIDVLDPRFLRREVHLRVPASQIDSFHELIESKGIELKKPEILKGFTRS